jgi:hypothetical protein
VDPYLKSPVMPGQRFWLFLYPQSISSLRHVWSHPAFGEEGALSPKQETSEQWLRNFCASADCPGYETVMEIIREGSVGSGYDHSYMDGDYIHIGGSDAHGEIPPEFWTHAEIVLGRSIPNKPSWFSCSC